MCYPSNQLEALDPLRHLGCGEALLTNFRALGVRYIQNDSLSYLILPSLLECGLYDEALKLNRQVLAFQLVAIKDANDMSVRAYQSKSYGSIFEMGAFMLKCTRSLQLALSKSDMIMLELIKVKSLEESELYMSQLLAGSLPESEPVLAFSQGGGEEYLASLSDNMDYTVLVRPDYARAEEERDAHLRRLASERRIRVICYLALILDCVRSGANDSRQSKWSAALSSELLVVVDETCWSASVEGGCSQEVTKSIADVTISFCQLCCGDEVKDGLLGAQLDSIQSQLSIPRSASSEQVGILDVQWLRESSLFLSTVGCWVIPMIAHKIMSVTCSNVIRSSAAMLLNAMGTFKARILSSFTVFMWLCPLF